MNQVIRTYYAGAEVNGYRFVKPGAADNAVLQAAANSDGIIGVSGSLVAAAAQPIDIAHTGLAKLLLGGTVTRGDKLTSDANGKGVELSDTILASAAAHCGAIALQSGVVGDIIDVLVVQQRVSKTSAIIASVAEIGVLIGAPMDAGIVVEAEETNAVAVAIQLKDADGDDLAIRGNILAYFSDDANGDSLAATAPSSGMAVGADGVAIELVTKKVYRLTSEVDGDIDLVVTNDTADTFYLVLVMPNGKLIVSDAITFTAG